MTGGSEGPIWSLDVFGDLATSTLGGIQAETKLVLLEPGQAPPALSPDFVALVISGSVLLCGGEKSSASVRVGAGKFFGEFGPRTPEITLAPTAEVRTELAVLAWNSLPANLQEKISEEINTQALCAELGSIAMFRELETQELAHLAASSECLRLGRGDILIREGEDANCFYVVLRGSLEIYRRRPDGSTHLIDVIERGACVGEMAVLLHEKRSANVRARRQSLVVKVHSESFDRLKRHAPMVLHLAETLSERLKQTTASTFSGPGIQAIALLPWCDPELFRDFSRALAQSFERAGHRVAVVEPPTSMQAERFADWYAQQSADHDYTLCVCADDIPASWRAWAVRQADLILCVASVNAPSRVSLPPEVKEARDAGAQVDLVFLRNPGQTATGTAEWLSRGPFDAHHHLVCGNNADFDRLIRRISGKAWGLVLGGGGARGLAHIGVIRAFEEAGIQIDMVGGTSMGAILAAQYAAGFDPAQMLAITKDAYTRGGSFRDMTLPLVSMRTGGGTIARLKAMFGDRAIEDLPIPYFCASCNLTRATTVIHDRGPLALAARVSCSVPGLLPPIAWNGDLLVDGALLNNLPVDAMRERMRGCVAASDVSVLVDLSVSPSMAPEPSWSGLGQMSRKILSRPAMPNIGSVLMRTAEIGSIRDARLAARPADLYLHVPVDEFSMNDFAVIDRIVALGYEYTAKRLLDWQASKS